MATADFLKDLPSHNPLNFSLFNTEHGLRTSQTRPSVYLPTEDSPIGQHIVVEKPCLMSYYLTATAENGAAPKAGRKRSRLEAGL